MSEHVPLVQIRDTRGNLMCGQYPGQLPFPARRFFVVSEVPAGQSRGGHGHRRCDQVLVMLVGSCSVRVWDDPHTVKVYALGTGGPALRLPPGTFSVQEDFSPGAILLVLASEVFDAGDYVSAEEFFDGG